MLSHRLCRFVLLCTGSFESFVAGVGRMTASGGFGAGHGEVLNIVIGLNYANLLLYMVSMLLIYHSRYNYFTFVILLYKLALLLALLSAVPFMNAILGPCRKWR
jgi:hypothetical protein